MRVVVRDAETDGEREGEKEMKKDARRCRKIEEARGREVKRWTSEDG